MKSATAYTLLKMAEFCHQVIFDNTDNLEKLITILKQNLCVSPSITLVIVNTFQNLFKSAYTLGQNARMSPYFNDIFTTIIELSKTGELQFSSDVSVIFDSLQDLVHFMEGQN